MKVYAIKNDKGQYWAGDTNQDSKYDWDYNLTYASFYPEQNIAKQVCEREQLFYNKKCVVVEICLKEK